MAHTLAEQLRAHEREHFVQILDARIRYWEDRGSVLASAHAQELRYIRNLVLTSAPIPPEGTALT